MAWEDVLVIKRIALLSDEYECCREGDLVGVIGGWWKALEIIEK
jgi:hypothetical protein